jgi:hypothetical protein
LEIINSSSKSNQPKLPKISEMVIHKMDMNCDVAILFCENGTNPRHSISLQEVRQLDVPDAAGGRRPGADSTKLRFGRNVFTTNFHPIALLSKFHPKSTEKNVMIVKD